VCSFAANLADVPPEITTVGEAQSTFFTAPLEGAICQGQLKALPVEYNLEYGGVVVNLDKYQARFPGKTPGWATFDEFLAEASMLTEYDAEGKPMANGLDIDPGWSPPGRHIFFAQILQRGGHFWGPTGDTFDLATPEARDSLTAMVDWVNKGKIMFRGLIPDKNTGVTARLAAGATGYGWNDPARPLSVMGYVGTWGVPSTAGQLPPNTTWHYDFFPLPPMVGTQHKFVTDGGWAFAVPRTSPNAKVAWDIVKSLTLSPSAMRKWSAITGALPALRANGTVEAAASDPVLARVQPLLELGRWRGYLPAQAYDAANGGMVSNFFAAVAGTKTIDQALADMQQAANNAIAQYR
jgi:multiple sugar transport system substrate-binding protein